MIRKTVIALACCWMLLEFASFAMGQQPATGVPPLSSTAGGPFDTVDLANLDVHFSIPIFARNGKGMPFSYNLSYDSLVWANIGSAWIPSGTWGWSAQTDAATGRVYGPSAQDTKCLDVNGHLIGWYVKHGPFTYYSPDGTSHTFPGTFDTSPDQDQCPTLPELHARATDGSGLKLDLVWQASTTVTSASGTVYDLYQHRITDTNGNTITTSTNGSVTTISDTLGTVALTIDATNPNAIKYQYPAPGGTVTVTVNYSTYYVATNFGVSGVSNYYFPNGTPTSLVSSIVLPDNTQYTFT